MKGEKIVIAFIAVSIGILVAGVAFFLYQTTKILPSTKTKTISISSPTSTPIPSVFLTVDRPRDEEVSDKKIITISGKTAPSAIIVISTQSTDQVITPASNGNFSTTLIIDDGENEIEITSIAPNGEEARIVRTVTYSIESF